MQMTLDPALRMVEAAREKALEIGVPNCAMLIGIIHS
jgi:hypothetical protein